MRTRRRRPRTAPAAVGLLLAVGGLLPVACGNKTPDAAQQADTKRWDNYQKDNKRDMATAQSAYEKRQAQLAAKKKAEAGDGKAEAPPAPSASPDAAASPAAAPPPAAPNRQP